MASMNVWARSRTALSMAALLALAACGGGGGSSSSGGTPSTVAVSGVASKGLLANAKVTAYAVKSNGTADTSKVLGSDITKADGSYQITGLPPSTPVILEVTPLAAEGTRPATTMKDEATGEVVPVPVGSGFSLSAALVLDATGTTSAQVTPFTDMAVKLAQAQATGPANGVSIADVINVANKAIADAVGIALNAAPAFEASTGNPTNAAAIKLAAVSELAQSACSGSSGTLAQIQCAVDILRYEVTDAPVAGEPLLSGTFVSNLNTAQAQVEVPVGVTAPPPVINVDTAVAVGGESKTAIQEAKTLIASVRATATALSNQSDTTSLAARVQAVADASRGVAQPLDDSTMTLLTALSEAITAHEDPATGLNFQLNSGVWWNGQPVSGCRYFTSDNFEIAASARTAYLGCRVVQRLGYTSGQPFMAYHRFGVIDGGTAGYTVKSRLGRALIISASPLVLGTEDLLSGASPRSLTVVSGQNALTVTGELAPGIESNWDTGTETAVVLGTHQKVALTLGEVVGATTTRYNLSGDVSVYSDTNVQSRVSLKSGSYIEEENVAGPTQPKAANLILEAQLNTGYKIGGTLVLSNFEQTATHNGPKNAVLNGYLTDMTGSAKLFDGTLTLIMPTDTGLNWDVKLDGTLVTTGANTLTVNLTALQPTLGEVTVTGRYTQGATTFLLTLLSSKTTPANDRLSLTTTAGGVGFVAQRSDTVVPIKKGATVLGQFNVDSSRLVYADGTYEQF